MRGNDILYTVLCTGLVLSLPHSRNTNEEQDLTQLLPTELWHEILIRVSLKDYLSTHQASKRMLRVSQLSFAGELEMRRRQFVGRLVAHMARTFLGLDTTPTRKIEVEERTRCTASGKLLQELMDEVVFTALEGEQNQRAVFACCETLVKDARLDAVFWKSYADANMRNVINGAAPRETVTKRLEMLLLMAAKEGSINVIAAIVASSEEAQVKVDLAARSNAMIGVAAEGGHVQVVAFLLAKREENPELYKDIDPATMDNHVIGLASAYGRVEVVRLLLSKKEENPELYSSIDPAAGGNFAIRSAAERGHVEVVQLLLMKKEHNPELYRHIDPAADNNHAIRWASRNGHDQVVALLLEKREEHPELYGNINPAAADGHNVLWTLPRRLKGTISRLQAKKDKLLNARAEALFCTIM